MVKAVLSLTAANLATGNCRHKMDFARCVEPLTQPTRADFSVDCDHDPRTKGVVVGQPSSQPWETTLQGGHDLADRGRRHVHLGLTRRQVTVHSGNPDGMLGRHLQPCAANAAAMRAGDIGSSAMRTPTAW